MSYVSFYIWDILENEPNKWIAATGVDDVPR